MAATCYLSGRLGNIVFNIAMLLAYCKKHNLQYYIPAEADAYNQHAGHRKNPLMLPSTGPKPVNPQRFKETNMVDGNPFFQDIPKMDNVLLDGYYQSFKYFDWCRDYILDTFNFPNNPEKITSVSVRRGDCVGSPNFPMAPREYYRNAIKYMQDKGFNKFRVYSDDQVWCKAEFVKENYPSATFEFSEGKTEMKDYVSLMNCENNITARSTFSLTGAWMNRNPNKIVCVPTMKFLWWRSINQHILADTGFIQIDFQNITD